MEGRESEAVLQKLMELKPQIFIYEILNGVDYLVDDACAIFRRQASAVVRTDENSQAPDLSRGVAYLQNKIHSVLEKNLGLWEKYCLFQCFNVPEGFCLPESDTYSAVNLPSVEALAEFELEEQHESLRSRVSQVRKESMELNKELQALERRFTSIDYFAKIITEAVELIRHDIFQELIKTADELRSKIVELGAHRMEVSQRKKKMRMDGQESGLSESDYRNVLDKMNLQVLQRFLVDF